MDLEDAQHDVTKATDAIKFLKRHSCGTVIVTLEQQVAMLDRRLRRVTRRYTRLVKSKHRDLKLEKYECCVDEMMDWLDQSELAVNDEVDIGRLERLQQQVCTCEVGCATHVKISQLVNKMCPQQACGKLVTNCNNADIL
jgi:hypothetical protein